MLAWLAAAAANITLARGGNSASSGLRNVGRVILAAAGWQPTCGRDRYQFLSKHSAGVCGNVWRSVVRPTAQLMLAGVGH